MSDTEDRVPEPARKPAARKAPAQEPLRVGHSWDGIEEYDNPMPRWWLWTFYATIVWALIYSILYPAWPMISGATPGVLGYSTRAEVAAEIARFDEANAPMRARLAEADLTAIGEEPDLLHFATNAGAAVYRTWCAQCHGSGAAGVQAAGYPNLLDDDWLWGGDIEEIHHTVSHGIRTDDMDTRWSEMPAFADMLDRAEIEQVVHYVLRISDQAHDAALAAAGEEVYAFNCASCHADDGTGDRFQGAPNLTDAIWLYGGDADSLTHTISYSRFGVMPAWNTRLSEADIRSVSVYVHGLGGGE